MNRQRFGRIYGPSARLTAGVERIVYARVLVTPVVEMGSCFDCAKGPIYPLADLQKVTADGKVLYCEPHHTKRMKRKKSGPKPRLDWAACEKGHTLSPDNTFVRKGKTFCRECTVRSVRTVTL